MIRKIIKINEDLCDGCALCVNACHESAIGIVNGKAKLLRDDYCDGLGNCLPVCPTNAISFEEREALDYNEEEVNRNIAESKRLKEIQEQAAKAETAHSPKQPMPPFGGCPGSRVMNISRQNEQSAAPTAPVAPAPVEAASQLRQWPVQIQLVPPNAPYFNQADLLIAADCTAYAHGNFHQFMKNKITLIGCPKLDEVDYSIKLTQSLSANNIKSVTVILMEVPCCGGIVQAVKTAMINSGQIIPLKVITIGTEGSIVAEN